MLNAKRLKNRPTEQGELLPTYTSDLIDEDHPARILSAIIDTLDLSVLYSKYSWEGGGFNPPIIYVHWEKLEKIKNT